MFEIRVTVEAPALTEAINNLANAMQARRIDHVDTLTINRTATVEKENPTDAPSAQAPEPTATVTEKVEPATDAPAPSDTKPEEKSYTVEEISDAGAALVDQGKMAQLCDLLARYGVQAITQLDPGTYPAFVADLKALGAQL